MLRAGIARLLESLPPAPRLFVKRKHYRQLVSNFDLSNEPDLLIAMALVAPGDCVLDVGANVGLWAYHLAKRVGTDGQVIAVEPLPETFAILGTVLKKVATGGRNDLLNCALSDVPGRMCMEVPRDSRGMKNHYLARLTDPHTADVTVDVCTLDSLLPICRGAVQFVKIDTEGHELAVIRGGTDLLAKYKPVLCIEISSDVDQPGSEGANLLELLQDLGYECQIAVSGQLRPRLPGERAVNYFFIPRSKQ